MKKIVGMMAGGLFNVRCEGTGMIAFTAYYEPLTLRVSPGNPMITDPNPTVAWSKRSSWYQELLLLSGVHHLFPSSIS
ncbi:AIM24 family protein [Bacillus sp. ISL-7]|nr:AIM24 family protein [Bacillus sp. ISL-7]